MCIETLISCICVYHKIYHFDTQITLEETKYFQDWLDWNEYMETIDRLDDESKAELDEIDMQCEKAEVEAIAKKMAQLDRGSISFV